MTAASVPQNRLLAQSGREFDPWQACHEFAEKSSKIVPLGAPFLLGPAYCEKFDLLVLSQFYSWEAIDTPVFCSKKQGSTV
jgi:hypothetical protein